MRVYHADFSVNLRYVLELWKMPSDVTFFPAPSKFLQRSKKWIFALAAWLKPSKTSWFLCDYFYGSVGKVDFLAQLAVAGIGLFNYSSVSKVAEGPNDQ